MNSRFPTFLYTLIAILLAVIIFLKIFNVQPSPTIVALPEVPTTTPIPVSTSTLTLTPQPSGIPQTVVPQTGIPQTNIPGIPGTATATPFDTPTLVATQQFTQTPIIQVQTTISAVDGADMVFIPAGEFIMGAPTDDPLAVPDEQPQHTVALDGYWIDRYEVTNAMFARFVAETGYQTDAERLGSGLVLPDSKRQWLDTPGANWQHPYGPDTSIFGLDDYPVAQVSWNDAQAYCAWAERRLPTEAEWEKAARGVEGFRFPWGNTPLAGNLLNSSDTNLKIVWADKNINDGYQKLAPVGSYPAGMSPYGLLDMAGNVWEWVGDWFSAAYYATSPSLNPTGPDAADSNTGKVARGGSWGYVEQGVRSANRDFHPQDFRSDNSGFRCAVTSLP